MINWVVVSDFVSTCLGWPDCASIPEVLLKKGWCNSADSTSECCVYDFEPDDESACDYTVVSIIGHMLVCSENSPDEVSAEVSCRGVRMTNICDAYVVWSAVDAGSG